MKRLFSMSAFLLVVVFFISSCQSNDNKNSGQETVTTPAPAPQETSNALSLEANDQMQYSKNELRAAAGQTITLTFKNTGTSDIHVMGHNFVLLKAGTDVSDFGTKAMSAKDHDYIPPSETANVLAHTKLLGGGESDTITFQLPEKGSYDYICSFPGHYGVMNGKLIIE